MPGRGDRGGEHQASLSHIIIIVVAVTIINTVHWEGSNFPEVTMPPNSSLMFTVIIPRSHIWEMTNLKACFEVSREQMFITDESGEVWPLCSTQHGLRHGKSWLSHRGSYCWQMLFVLCSISLGSFPISKPLSFRFDFTLSTSLPFLCRRAALMPTETALPVCTESRKCLEMFVSPSEIALN